MGLAVSMLWMAMAWVGAGDSAKPANPIEAVAVYGIAAKAAIPVLPDSLELFLNQRIPLLIRSAEQAFHDHPAAHRFYLDSGAGLLDDEALGRKIEFLRTMPAGADRSVTEGDDAGELTSLLRQRTVLLTENFRLRPQEAIEICGEIVHLSVDACLPFHLTQLAKGSHADVVRRFEVDLVVQAHSRLEDEVRVSAERFSRVSDSLAIILESMQSSYSELHRVMALPGLQTSESKDREAHERDRPPWMEKGTVILESRIECGALLAANLIGSAWMDAGSPKLDVASGPEKNASKSESFNTTAAFVGSSSSKTFHRSDCAHAARIKLENRISFRSRAEAASAGRRPCRTCKPE